MAKSTSDVTTLTAGLRWQEYVKEHGPENDGEEYSPVSLGRFVIEAWRDGYIVDGDDIDALVEGASVWKSLHPSDVTMVQDQIVFQVAAIVATLTVLRDEYRLEVPIK